MVELVGHPGYFDFYVDPLTGRRTEVVRDDHTLDEFLEFMRLGDLDAELNNFFRVFLERLYGETRDFWIPCYCTHIDMLWTHGKIILGKLRPEVEVKLGRRVFGAGSNSEHFWMSMEAITQGRHLPLVIDPFGIPQAEPLDWNKAELVVPYFGLVQLSPNYSRKVYEGSEIMR